MNSPDALHITHPQGCCFIANRWHEPHSGQVIEVIDPATALPYAHVARGDAFDVAAAVAAARSAFAGEWGRTSGMERGRVLARIAQAISDHADRLAWIESRDVGKPISQSRADLAATARYFEFYAGAADKLGGDVIPLKPGFTAFAERVPLGVTGHIVPWNYPTQIFGRSVAAALAAGNACVVKPPEDACLALLEIADLALQVGLPAGALNLVPGYGAEAGAELAAHHDIDHISFTGSPPTGSSVSRAAAEHHCPVTLELGGKSAQIVFADADLDHAAATIARSIIQNAGQTCSAGSRLLVERAAYEPFLALIGQHFQSAVAGPGYLDLQLGPLVNERQMKRVASYLGMALVDNIATAARGTIHGDASSNGYFIEPHLLRDVPHDHPLTQEEIFGPVLVAAPFEGEAEAVARANGTQYGLVAGVWTADGGRALRLAKALHCGQVFINDYGAGGGIELPFGGVKMSGHGREKGLAGLLSFTTLKTISIRHG